MTNARRQGVKGAYHLHFLALRFSEYWRAQKRSPARVVRGDPDEIIDMIELGQQWEHTTTQRLAVVLNLDVLGRSGRAQAHVNLDNNAKTQGTATSTQSVITDLTIGDISELDLKKLVRSSGKSTVGDIKGKENENFHHVLFGNIKERTVGELIVKSRDVCKISRRESFRP